MYDPMSARFDNRPLEPWQKSKAMFDFDEGFVSHIQIYLKDRNKPANLLAAKQWINRFKFDQERYELCHLQWSNYEERKSRSQPTPIDTADRGCQPVGNVGDRIGTGGDRQSNVEELTPEQRAANFKRLREMITKGRIGE